MPELSGAASRGEIDITVVRSLHPELARELSSFLSALVEERRWFATSTREVLRSELVVVARIDGHIVGLSGICRRFVHLPFLYYVVQRDHQGSRVLWKLAQAQLSARDAYPVVFAIVMSDNTRALACAQRAHFKLAYDDGRYAYFCKSQSSALGRVVAAALRLALPPTLAIYRRVRFPRGGR